MNLREAIKRIGELSDDLVIFASKNGGDWNLDSSVALILASDIPEIGVDLEGLSYFLEVEIAREVLNVWTEWRNGQEPTESERTEALLYYVNNDAYLAAE